MTYYCQSSVYLFVDMKTKNNTLCHCFQFLSCFYCRLADSGILCVLTIFDEPTFRCHVLGMENDIADLVIMVICVFW